MHHEAWCRRSNRSAAGRQNKSKSGSSRGLAFGNGLTWDQLAAKKVNRVGRADTPYYETRELQAAMELTKHVEKIAKSKASESTGSSE